MAVHLQRVEVLVAGTLGLGLVAAENLRLGLGIEPAQLVAYAVDGRFHLAEGEADITDLLFDTTAEDRGLTRQVDQPFEQLGRHLDQFLWCTARGGFLRSLLRALHERQHLARLNLARHITGGHDRVEQRGEHIGARVGLGDRRRFLLTGEAGAQALAQEVKLLLQPFEAGLHVEEQTFRPGCSLLQRLGEVLLKVMAQIAQTPLPGQTRAALEGMQDTLHFFDGTDVITLRLEAANDRFHGFEQVIALFEEDIENVAVGLFGCITVDHGLELYRLRYAQLFVGVGPEALDGFDQGSALRHDTLAAHGIEHLGQTVMTGLQQSE